MTEAPLPSTAMPVERPRRPCFSSGPCAKRPGWSLDHLRAAEIGRSHRSRAGKAKLGEVLDRSRAVLGIPSSHRIAIVAGSDTGAVEMALWSLLGPRGVDILAWESFGKGWLQDATQQLRLADLRKLEAPYGALPDLSAVDFARDVVFTWNGTTSGVRVPDGDWIPLDRKGLTICDATSAVFAMALPWNRLDVVTWSWQKALGGEAAHGMLVLGPRAVERLESHQPAWPLPKIFQLVTKGKLNEGVFKGDTINTPSLLCVEDAIDSLRWAELIGGLPALIRRTSENYRAVADWVERRAWIDFLAKEPATRSPTSVCLAFADGWVRALAPEQQAQFAKALADRVEAEQAGYDIGAYRDAPPGLRIWAGPTVEQADLHALFPWLDWAYDAVGREFR